MIIIPTNPHRIRVPSVLTGVTLAISVHGQLLSLSGWDLFVKRWGMIPALMRQHPETLITAQFIHSGFMHLITNLIFLWAFGVLVEEWFGITLTLCFYGSGGILGYLVYAALNHGSSIPLLGASSAIATLMGIVAVLQPERRIQVWLLLTPPIPVPIWLFIGFWVFQQVSNAFIPLATTAYSAHLVGFFFGVTVGIITRLLPDSESIN